MSIDDQIAERKLEEYEFNKKMFAHLDLNPAGCMELSCLYCGSYADHLRDEKKAREGEAIHYALTEEW